MLLALIILTIDYVPIPFRDATPFVLLLRYLKHCILFSGGKKIAFVGVRSFSLKKIYPVQGRPPAAQCMPEIVEDLHTAVGISRA